MPLAPLSLRGGKSSVAVEMVVPRDVPLLRKMPVRDRPAITPRVTSVHLVRCCFPGCAFERGDEVFTRTPFITMATTTWCIYKTNLNW